MNIEDRILEKMKNGELIRTDYERVFYLDESVRKLPGRREKESIAKKVAKSFPRFTIVITVSQGLFHDVAYEFSKEEKLILLDLPHPDRRYTDDMIREIRQKMRGTYWDHVEITYNGLRDYIIEEIKENGVRIPEKYEKPSITFDPKSSGHYHPKKNQIVFPRNSTKNSKNMRRKRIMIGNIFTSLCKVNTKIDAKQGTILSIFAEKTGRILLLPSEKEFDIIKKVAKSKPYPHRIGFRLALEVEEHKGGVKQFFNTYQAFFLKNTEEKVQAIEEWIDQSIEHFEP